MSLVDSLGPESKTPSVQTLGVLLSGLFGFVFSALVLADCIPESASEMAVVDRIYDGDTIKLEDGRHIRILGVNAPEVDHGKDKPGQALGEDARRATEAFFKRDKHVRLFFDIQRLDRYGRTLAHVYDIKGNSLSAHLLRLGLGFHVAIPPNVSLNECLYAEEIIARRKALGVWSHPYWRAKPAHELGIDDTGFQRVQGQVVDVHVAQSVWLELDGMLVIKISFSDQQYFPHHDWLAWKGKRVEVRGWVTSRADEAALDKAISSSKKHYKPLIVQPRIADDLEILN